MQERLSAAPAHPKNKNRFSCFYKSWIKRNAPPRVPPRVKIRGTKEYEGMVELGSDASAAGGGSSELSAWQRSARDEGFSKPRTFAGHRNRKTRWIKVLSPQGRFFHSATCTKIKYADMAKLVYAIGLGPIVRPCRFESCYPPHRSCCLRAAASFVFRISSLSGWMLPSVPGSRGL